MKEAIAHLSRDKKFKKIIETVEMPQRETNKDIYISLIRAIVSQQLSVKAANTIYTRFLALFNNAYPDPKNLLLFDLETLRSVGLSRQKAAYIQNIADFDQNKGLDFDIIDKMNDDEVIKYLTQIKGVGRWTVEMLLMFTLDRPDILPLDDLGIQQAMIKLFDIEETGKVLKERMIELAEPWRPYRTLACRYLWRWKDNE